MAEKYLSVQEFAAAAGVSQQAIYKRLDKSLKPFVKVVDGKKKVSEDGLALYQKSTIQPTQQPTIQPTFNNQVETVENFGAEVDDTPNETTTNHSTSLTTDKEQIQTLTRMVDIIQRELEVKNKQIADLNDRLAEALKTVEAQKILIRQQQQLSLLDKTEGKAEKTTEQGEEITQVGASLDRHNAAAIEPEKKNSEAQKEKKSFWQRLFGK